MTFQRICFISSPVHLAQSQTKTVIITYSNGFHCRVSRTTLKMSLASETMINDREVSLG